MITSAPAACRCSATGLWSWSRQPCRKNNLNLASPSDALAVRGSAFDELDELARDERFVLCRARRKGDGTSVLLKRPLEAAASAADIALLAREFELLRSLPLDSITKPIDLLTDALVLEDIIVLKRDLADRVDDAERERHLAQFQLD